MMTWRNLLEQFPKINAKGAALIMRVPEDRAEKELAQRRRWAETPMRLRLHRKDARKLAAAQVGMHCYMIDLPSLDHATDRSMVTSVVMRENGPSVDDQGRNRTAEQTGRTVLQELVYIDKRAQSYGA